MPSPSLSRSRPLHRGVADPTRLASRPIGCGVRRALVAAALLATTALPAQGTSTAAFTAYGSGCGGGGAPGIYELFSSTSQNDLPGASLTFLFVGSSYLVLTGLSPFVPPSGGQLALGDDQTTQVALPWPMPHPGGTTSQLSVCSNGFIGLEMTTNASFSPSVASLLSDVARICVYWVDLNPGAGGTVNAALDPTTNSFHVTWSNVPLFGSGGSNTMQATFEPNGTFHLKWVSMTAVTGLVGYHPGHGAADPGMSDLSTVSAQLLGTGTSDLLLSNLGGSRPRLGTTFTAQIGNVPATARFGVLVLGMTSFNPGLDLSGIGMAGCQQYVSLDHSVLLLPSGTTTNVSLPIPSNPRFAGSHVFLQAAMSGGTTAIGIISSNGADLLLNPL